MEIVAPAVVLETTPVITVSPEPCTERLRADPSEPRSTAPESARVLPRAMVLTSVKPPLTSLNGLAKLMP